MRRLLFAVLLLLASPALAAPALAAPGGKHGDVDWQAWSPALFERAAREGKYILLHLGADWCHWCHVMEDTSYRDPAVLALIEQRYIPVRVEQDRNPELSQRYENFGWPATIFFDSDGNEIGKRRGYQPPDFYARLLQAIIDDPSALQQGKLVEDDAPKQTALRPERRAAILKAFDATLDEQRGGIGEVHRFLHGDSVEFALTQEGRHKDWARLSLRQAEKIIDPVWGGLYQYSDALDWSSPHYEKLLSSQVTGLKLYAQAFAGSREAEWQRLGDLIGRYLAERMQDSETGAFYVSQDADLNKSMDGKAFYALSAAERARLGGQPKIDRNLYAREAGWGASAMLAWHDLGNAGALARAERAAAWALQNRRLPDGSFGHAAATDAEATLSDTLAMGEALLGLYRTTGGRDWLQSASAAGQAIATRFKDERGGYFVRAPDANARGVFREPVRHVDDNIAATRLLNRLFHYTGEPEFDAGAAHGFAYLAALAENDLPLPGVLLAATERERPPLHVTIVGGKADPAAQALHEAARRLPQAYQRLDWWDRAEGPMLNDDVRYPELDQAAAFVCTDKVCSLPMFDAAELGADVKRFAGQP